MLRARVVDLDDQHDVRARGIGRRRHRHARPVFSGVPLLGDGQPRAGERQGRVRRVVVECLEVEADPVAVERNRAVDVRDGEDRTRAPGAQLCVWPPSATMS